MTHATILAMHYCVPPTVLGRDELIERFGQRAVVAIEKISGIKERRIVAPEVTSVDLAVFAAEQILQRHSDLRDEIDTVIFCTQTGDHTIPPSAAIAHERLGLRRDCLTFDVQHGCPSFPIGLSLAKSLIESGVRSHVLLINADTLTKIIHPMDRALVPLHGDGAAVTVVGSTDDPAAGAVGRIEHGTDSSGHRFLMVHASGARTPKTAETATEIVDASGATRTAEHLQMDGAAVFQFSMHAVPDAIKLFLENGPTTIDQYSKVVFHQANKMMLDGIYDRIEASPEQRFYFLETVGNTSAASLPMALAEAIRTKAVNPGDSTLFAAFGVGLAWGVGEVKWGNLLDTSDLEVTYA